MRQTEPVTLVYDTNINPISFDFCWALAWADLTIRRLGVSSFDVALIDLDSSFEHAMPPEHPDHVRASELLWRIREILLPLARHYRSVHSVSLLPRELTVRHLLGRHLLTVPASLPVVYRAVLAGSAEGLMPRGFGAGAAGRQAVKHLLGDDDGRKVITITLRNNRGGAGRNSNILAWRSFVDELDEAAFRIVVIPDSETAFNADFPATMMFSPAAFNMPLRIALYEHAFVNMFVNNGPASLCILTPEMPYLLFKILVAGERLASREVIEELGFVIGAPPAVASESRRWIWKPDDVDVLRGAFHDWCDTRKV